jgi:heat shock protein HslJ
MKLITFLSAGAFIVLSAFVMKKEKITPTTSLYNTNWSLQKIYTETGVEEVNTKAFIKLDEEKTRAGGNGSCNTFGSSFIITNNKISFKNIFFTKMYCEGVQQTENTFFKQLEKVNRFEVKDKRLFFYQDNQTLLEFQSK